MLPAFRRMVLLVMYAKDMPPVTADLLLMRSGGTVSFQAEKMIKS